MPDSTVPYSTLPDSALPDPGRPAGTDLPVQKHYSPTQSWHASHMQFDDGRCDGFVRSVEITQPKGDATGPMTYWTEADLPFFHGLARTFHA